MPVIKAPKARMMYMTNIQSSRVTFFIGGP
jgi:hypothetical protein